MPTFHFLKEWHIHMFQGNKKIGKLSGEDETKKKERSRY